MTVSLARTSRAAMLASIGDAVDASNSPGYLSIYGGQQPRGADEAPGDRPLLARLPFGRPSFTAPSRDGSMSARPIAQAPATATGRATWARITNGNGDAVMDLDVGESGTALVMASTQLAERGPVIINALVLRMPAS